ncbi:Increased DNA methylation 1 [Vitis vinifera]|uniref:Increased DNA methylation 1 n=1 Tax=Vitis vinifera TaxID=29760 RepID=A0A438KGH2_VITVI|nr:Increased DNA methylation 1 [Vitis vinifera]
MEKGSDSEEFVMSRIRPGFKREFAFVVKAQSMIGGSLSLGRTRTQTQTKKDRGGPSRNRVLENSIKKRQKSSGLDSQKNNVEERFPEDRVRSNDGKLMDNKVVRSGQGEQGNDSTDNPMQIGRDNESMSGPAEEEELDYLPTSTLREGVKTSRTPSVDGLKKAPSSQNQRRVSRVTLKPKANAMKISVVNNGEKNVVKMGSSAMVPSTLKGFPTKLKELLDTGILEDLPVQYIRGLRRKENGESGLHGVIKGSGILCYCDTCKGTNVVTPNVFELHAGSSNKRPPEYIYLENGNTLRSVMTACSKATLKALDEDIRVAIGSSIKKSTFCFNCKGSISEVGTSDSLVLCESCVGLKESHASPAQPTGTSDRDVGLHKLAFGENDLPEGSEVSYYVRGERLLSGHKKGCRILCDCCNSEVSPSQFEAHSGWASRRKPYLHIYTSNGVSLHELSLSLLRGREPSINTNDEICSICLDGGTLLCCDGCPRVFHKECVSLENIPKGKWFCKFCLNTLQKGKFVERNANAVAAGRMGGVDPIEQIRKRCIRIVKSQTDEAGGCALCRRHEFSTSGFGPHTVMICDQCEKEFHVGCLKAHNIDDLKAVPKGKWFCCRDCKDINSSLRKIVVRREEELPDDVLRIIKKRYGRKGSVCSGNPDIKWRLLHGRRASATEAGSLLSQALSLFHEQFNPIADAEGRDLLLDMVHSNSTGELEFGGMYCAILTVGCQVVSAATFRVLGKEVAELPLVATRSDCQGQGYFQALYTCIERLLCFLQVNSLVLPAAEGAESLWINKFKFHKMEQEEMLRLVHVHFALQLNHLCRDFQMMTFQGTSMLQKPVPEYRRISQEKLKIGSY